MSQRYSDLRGPEAAAVLSALAGRTLGRVRALAAETLAGDLEFAEIELTFEGGPTLVLGLGQAGREGPRGGAGEEPQHEIWIAPGAMGHEADPSNPWQPMTLDAHPVWRPRLGSRVLVAAAVRGGDALGAPPGLTTEDQPITGVVFAFDDGRRIEVYDAGRCLHMVILPDASATAGADPSR
jgi:hypothetical protein